MKVNAAEPLILFPTARELADVRRFAGVEAGMNKHVGALGERFAALGARVEGPWLSDAGSGLAVHGENEI